MPAMVNLRRPQCGLLRIIREWERFDKRQGAESGNQVAAGQDARSRSRTFSSP